MEKELQIVNEMLLQVRFNFLKARFLKAPNVYIVCALIRDSFTKALFGGQKGNSQNHNSVLNYQSIYYSQFIKKTHAMAFGEAGCPRLS